MRGVEEGRESDWITITVPIIGVGWICLFDVGGCEGMISLPGLPYLSCQDLLPG